MLLSTPRNYEFFVVNCQLFRYLVECLHKSVDFLFGDAERRNEADCVDTARESGVDGVKIEGTSVHETEDGYIFTGGLLEVNSIADARRGRVVVKLASSLVVVDDVLYFSFFNTKAS